MQFEERYLKLNPEQKQAVDAIFGPVVVIAGPGSGKTEILSLRIANILKTTDADPASILCLTFTENAAKNMRKRLLGLIGPQAHRVGIYTFHGFGSALMQRYPEFFHGGHTFRPADDVVRIGLIQTILKRLPVNNPLSSYAEAHGFVYEKDILACLSDFRRAGIRPEQFVEVIESMRAFQSAFENDFVKTFYPRVTKETKNQIAKLVEILREKPSREIGLFTPPEIQMAFELERVLAQVDAEDSNTPISKFKSHFFDKSQQGEPTLFSDKTFAKWEGLAQIYKEYQQDLFDGGWYDFDDMIMESLFQLSENPEFVARVHEQYQFIMVDEYQDTSTAQLQLLLQLLPEEQPNILVVGDDDQSIYSFQGANVKNLKSFFALFPNSDTIILRTNYRSQPNIVELGQAIIQHSDERITDIIPTLSKELESAHKELGEIRVVKTKTWDEEKAFLVEQITDLIGEGTSAGEIAVIAREHGQLIDIAASLHARQVPVHYDYHANIFEMQEVQLLIDVWRCVHALQTTKLYDAHRYFYSFARHKAFGVTLSGLFDTVNQAHKQKATIFHESVYQNAPAEIRNMIESLLSFAQTTVGTSFERVHEGLAVLGEKDGWPYYAQAFLNTELGDIHIETIFALRNLVHTIRQHHRNEYITLEEALQCVDAYKQAKRRIPLKIPGYHASDKVHLLTAHGSKGLEYENVFIVCADDSTWFSRRAHGKISLPFIIPDQQEHNENESVRLFYVSVTRAKKALTISRHQYDDKGNEILPLRVLDLEEEIYETMAQPRVIGPSIQIMPPDEQSILRGVLEGFTLTATHINSFLDVISGGPEQFKWNTLYRFPRPKSYSAEYGTLVHAALTEAYQKELSQQQAAAFFASYLDSSSLDPRERERAEHDFKEDFGAFWSQLVEADRAKSQSYLLEYPTHSEVGGVPIRGNLDKVTIAEEAVTIVDYKTGAAHTSLKTGTEYQKLKVHKYMRQLQFYFLLLTQDMRIPKNRPLAGRIEFFEKDQKGKCHALDYTPTEDELAYMSALIARVYECLQNHSFPAIDQYEKTLAGVLKFEQDLVEGKYS